MYIVHPYLFVCTLALVPIGQSDLVTIESGG
jgi:hypothetical protein